MAGAACVACLLALSVAPSDGEAKCATQVQMLPSATISGPVAPLAFASLSLVQAQDAGAALSPDVLVAQSRVRAADAAVAAARAGFMPSLVSGYAANPQAGPTASSTVTQTLVNVGLQATLNNFAGYLPTLYQAQALDNAARANEATAERLERIRVSALYFGALSAHATALARHEALKLATAQERAAQHRFIEGDAPHVDVVRAEVAAAQAQAAYASAQAADENATEAVKLETGFTGDLSATIAGASPAAKTFATPAAAVSAALLQRSELVAAKQDVAAANDAVSAAKAAALPALTMSAGYAQGLDTGQRVSGPAVTATLEFPLNGTQTARIAQSRAAVQEAQATLTAAQRLVTGEVSSSVRNANAAVEAAAASSKARSAAQEELRATEIGYRQGASSGLDLTIASSTYVDARVAELAALYDEALAQTTLSLELGP